MKKHYRGIHSSSRFAVACGETFSRCSKTKKHIKNHILPREQILSKLDNKGVCQACKRIAVVERLEGVADPGKSMWAAAYNMGADNIKGRLQGQSFDGVIIDDPLPPEWKTTVAVGHDDIEWDKSVLDDISKVRKELGL